VATRTVPIVQICPCYVDLGNETGGVANVVRQICLGLARRGRHVRLICGDRELGRRKAEAGFRKISDLLEVHVVRQRFHPLLGPVSQLKAILSQVAERFVGHVHTCFSGFSEFAMWYMGKRGIPFAFTPHGKLHRGLLTTHKWLKRLWWQCLARRGVLGAGAIVLQGHGEAMSFPYLGLGGRDYAVIPNGYDGKGPSSAAQARDIILPDRFVVFLGFLDPRKRPEFLVQAFAASRARRSHKLLLVGPDSYGHKQKVQDAISQGGVADQVVLWGPAYGPIKWRLLSQADVLALPSLGEGGAPIVVCEALGAGVPAIMSKACNFSVPVEAGASIEIEGFDVSEWAAAIDAVCLDAARRARMASVARRLAPGYTWDHIVDRWIEVYDQLARFAGSEKAT